MATHVKHAPAIPVPTPEGIHTFEFTDSEVLALYVVLSRVAIRDTDPGSDGETYPHNPIFEAFSHAASLLPIPPVDRFQVACSVPDRYLPAPD